MSKDPSVGSADYFEDQKLRGEGSAPWYQKCKELEFSLAQAREEIAKLKAHISKHADHLADCKIEDNLKAERDKLREALETISLEAEHPHNQQSSVWEQLIIIGKLAKLALESEK